MRNINYKILTVCFAAIIMIGVAACKKSFLEQETIGLLTEAELQSSKGANQLLTSTYSAIKGIGWEGGGSNWVYGSIVGMEANKGSDAGDQADINPIQQYAHLPGNNYFNVKWRSLYEGIARANATIRVTTALTQEQISDADKNQILAEARFLRGFYHLDAKKMWNKIPYVNENVKYGTALADVSNSVDAWPMIMEDLDFARKTLTPTKAQVGRVNKWAAEAFYAKALLFQQKFAEALPILTDVINNGVTSGGIKYNLSPSYHDQFNADAENLPTTRAESVFAYEASINDGSGGQNANWEHILNFPHNNGPGGCCGFFQPTFDFVISFRTTAAGLPLLDNSYNSPANLVKNDMGLEAADAFTPDAGNLDPRLDWTVGRRGIPFLDWGPHPGKSWIRDMGNGGPYTPKKMSYYREQTGKLTDGTSWTSGLTATNYKLMRFADVLLMAAEAEAEAGTLAKATEYVNRVRQRASNPATWVKNGANNAANYVIGTYPVFADKDYARAAIRMERKLELGMEGHRFFDLVRWGIAEQEIDRMLANEKLKLAAVYGNADFVSPKHLYFPIPQRQIDLQQEGGQSTLEQNPDY